MANTNIPFKYILQEVRLVKAIDDDEWVISGIAAGPVPDSVGDRFSVDAAEQVAAQINRMPLPLHDWHARNTILGLPIGEVYKAWVTSDGEVGIEARLDKSHMTAQMLRQKLSEGKQFGLSVGGKVLSYKDEFEKSVGKKVRTFTDIILDEISVTTKPFYQPSLGTVISKAIDEAESASVEEGDNSLDNTVETPEAAETQAETPEVVQEPTDTAAAPEVEKSLDSIVEALITRIDQRIDEKFAQFTISNAPAADSQPEGTEQVTEKSETQTDGAGIVVKALEEVLRRLERIEERTPDVNGPGVLTQKSEIEQLNEVISSMTPSERLRFGLRAKHTEL
jgi:hypothetical protein